MTVVSFPAWRFTPSDLQRIYEFAAPRMADGRWGAVTRMTLPQEDRFLIYRRLALQPGYSIKKDRRGQFFLHLHYDNSEYCLATSFQIDRCLRFRLG
jgi:hypothetical protein